MIWKAVVQEVMQRAARELEHRLRTMLPPKFHRHQHLPKKHQLRNQHLNQHHLPKKHQLRRHRNQLLSLRHPNRKLQRNQLRPNLLTIHLAKRLPNQLQRNLMPPQQLTLDSTTCLATLRILRKKERHPRRHPPRMTCSVIPRPKLPLPNLRPPRTICLANLQPKPKLHPQWTTSLAHRLPRKRK